MEELYKVMDDLLEVEFQMKAGMDILKELEEFYMLEKETEKSDARKVAVLMKGYLQSMKSNIREIIRYIDDTTLEKSNDKKKDKQESTSTIPEEVQEFVNLTITEHMGKAYSEWKLKQDKEPVSEIDKKYQKLLETLSPEQEEVITEYCNAIFSSGADTEEFFYRLGLKDGLNLKNAVKFVLEIVPFLTDRSTFSPFSKVRIALRLPVSGNETTAATTASLFCVLL